jgi:signal transduction histidine kinase
MGIERENLVKIFEPYFSTKKTGVGLGLAIVKKIIEEHNGEISVKSQPKKGTTFFIRLPF